MVQKFKLVAPCARSAQPDGSHIGEMLFADSGRYLVELLAVPVLRKGDRKQPPVEPQDTS
ncbi:hypothetical protein ACHAQJ_002213 [Trichoderma viride]